jgi:hypothetical protein
MSKTLREWWTVGFFLIIPSIVMAQMNPENNSVRCGVVVSAGFAQNFADDWISAWNSHDLDRILAHYTDDFEMRSPGIIAIAREPSGVLRGKAKIRSYWEEALKTQPNLKFELIGVYAGIGSVAIHYRNASGLAVVEVLELDSNCKVVRGNAIRSIPRP